MIALGQPGPAAEETVCGTCSIFERATAEPRFDRPYAAVLDSGHERQRSMSDPKTRLEAIVPPEVWATGARLGWQPDEIHRWEDVGVSIMLAHTPSHATFAIDVMPAGHGERSFVR